MQAALDTGEYRKGLEYHDRDIKALPITGASFHPEWNYTITADAARAVATLPEPRLRRAPVKERKHNLETIREHRSAWAEAIADDPETIGMTTDQFRSLAADIATETDIIDPTETPALTSGRKRHAQSLTLFQHLAMTLAYLNTRATQGQLRDILRISAPTTIAYLKEMTKRLETIGYQPKPKRQQLPLASRHLIKAVTDNTPENTNLNFDGSLVSAQ